MLTASKVKRRTITTTKKGKTDRQKIIKKLDDLVSKIVRERDGYHCVICGTTQKLQCGHLFSRTSFSTRWDLRDDGNNHVQCQGHNLMHEHDSAPYTLWYIEKFGLERYQLLYAEYRTVSKWSTVELELLYRDIKSRFPSAGADIIRSPR